MQDARPGAVLGRFDGVTFTEGRVTSRFLRRGDRYFVNTQGSDGELHEFEIRYTFGVFPLQQYLVALPGGRMQAFTIAWDARPAIQGGQRWYSLTAGASPAPTDPLHWTGRGYNWNFMCADCHSTGVSKGYNASADSFHTTRSEINVACEACHGPGSRHAARAEYPGWLRHVLWNDDGLPARLTERDGVRWSTDSSSGHPNRSATRRTDHEIEICAQCHARRVHIADGYTAGAPLLDYYIPSLILPGLYYPDGQQLDEVYNYGSFLQSRMYAAGVTCADCHDPHTQQLRRTGNQLCTQCHLAARYDAPTHHFHAPASAGAQCVECHMPAAIYMGIDARRDHSIRVPRPDLSQELGIPNACNGCHSNHDARWAAAQVRAWYGASATGFQRFALAFAADDRHDPGAADSLFLVTSDSTEPAIVRASALARLGAYPGPAALRAAQTGSHDPNPLVRLGALQILEAFPPRDGMSIAEALLADSTRAVRQGAAWLLAPIAKSLTAPASRSAFEAAAAEFVASQRYNADQPGDRLALGVFYGQLGRLDSAADEFRAALRLAPHFRQAELDLAAVLRAQGRKQ
jgi:predicted CXXCH cytochrome family protein